MPDKDKNPCFFFYKSSEGEWRLTKPGCRHVLSKQDAKLLIKLSQEIAKRSALHSSAAA